MCQNDLSDMDRLSNTPRDQFGTLHERETNRRKGKGNRSSTFVAIDY